MFGKRGRMTLRIMVLAAFFAVSGAVLAARVAYVQIVRADHYRGEARDEHFGQEELRAPRGAILDRNGYPLATTVDAFDVFINREDWADDFAAKQGAEFIAPVIGADPVDLINKVRAHDGSLYLAFSGLDYEQGAALHDADAPGLRIVQTTKRFYPEGDLASSLLGFVGRDHVGLTGIEKDFDTELGGKPGTFYFERDSIGNRIQLGAERIGKQPEPGGDIELTIDRYIQRLVEGRLEEEIARTKALGGSIVVMDPATGEVLAMASQPTFRLSQLRDGDIDQALVRNRAVTDVYEPGSVFKVLTAAMAIELGHVTPESTYNDTGASFIGESTIRNWDYSVNGITSVTQVLQRSLNTGAVWMAQMIGPEAFYKYLRDFGLGEATHVGLGGEADGLVRSHEDPAWAPVDLATNSFGQGVAATPLQVVSAIAAIANDGKLMRPYVVRRAVTADGVRTFEPSVVRQVVSERTAAAVTDMMNQVVEGVPGNLARVSGYHVAGKTGTTTGATLADGAVLNGNIASFIGFAPVDEPRIIVLVKLDFKEDRLGGQVAAPVFADIVPKILAYLGVRPEGAQQVSAAP